MTCPSCNSDNIQRLEVVYDQGTNQINTTSRSHVRPFFGIIPFASAKTKTSGMSISNAAQKAAPPKKKTIKGFVVLLVLGLFIVSGDQTRTAGTLMSVVGAVLIFLNVRYNMKEWPKLFETWERTWTCNKCGNRFVL